MSWLPHGVDGQAGRGGDDTLLGRCRTGMVAIGCS